MGGNKRTRRIMAAKRANAKEKEKEKEKEEKERAELSKKGRSKGRATAEATPPPAKEQPARPRWTGKMPLTQLMEYAQKNKWAKPQFNQMRAPRAEKKAVKSEAAADPPGGSVEAAAEEEEEEVTKRFRWGVRMYHTVDKVTVRFKTEDAYDCSQVAKHSTAVVALHHFCHNLPLDRGFPAYDGYRELWKRLDGEYAKKEEMAARREEREAKRQRQLEKQKQYEKFKDRITMSVSMSEQARGEIYSMLCKEGSLTDAARTAAERIWEGPAMQEAWKTLQTKGFAGDATKEALLRLASSGALDEEDDAAVIVSAALDWLCLHTPEDELPPEFRTKAYSQPALLHSATKATASPLSEEEKTVGLLTGQGYGLKEALDALAHANSDVGMALTRLFSATVARSMLEELQLEEMGEAEVLDCDVEEQQQMEKETLEAVYAESFSVEEGKESVAWTVDLEELGKVILFLRPDSRYPYELPDAIAVTSPQLQAGQRAFLVKTALKDALEQQGIGEPLVFSLASFVIENHASVAEMSISEAQSDDAAALAAARTEQEEREMRKEQRAEQAKKAKKGQRRQRKKHLSPQQLKAEGERLQAEFVEQSIRQKNSKQQRARAALPAYTKKDDIVDQLAKSRVLIIGGGTGCGKTTQVPQYILEHMLASGRGAACNIICTQPRRLAAIGVAERVAWERQEQLPPAKGSGGGHTGHVGYQIRLERRATESTRLLFCTTGILLRRLQDDRDLEGVSHVIVDEVHERSLECDFLLILLRELLKRRKGLHVLLMSATLENGLFESYFREHSPATVTIPGFTFPVEQFFIEDVALAADDSLRPSLITGGGPGRKQDDSRRAREGEIIDFYRGSGYPCDLIEAVAALPEKGINVAAVEAMVVHILRQKGGRGAILIFMPGLAEILAVRDRLQGSAVGGQLWLLPLHSSIGSASQKKVFDAPPKGLWKVVISTNIAETSITIPDVLYVIDAGKAKQNTYDAEARVAALREVGISRASAKQRSGRAGRVQAGQCYRLYSRYQYESKFPEHDLPEIKRTPLDQLYLQVKVLLCRAYDDQGHEEADFADALAQAKAWRALEARRMQVCEFLQSAPEPPTHEAIAAAEAALVELGAIASLGQAAPRKGSKVAGQRSLAHLLPLGWHLSRLPIDARLGKMLVFGAIHRCIDPILTICAGLSGNSPFVAPLEKRDEARAAKARFAWAKSDLLTIVKAYDAFQESSRNYREAAAFCQENFLSKNTLETMRKMKKQYAEMLADIGLLPLRRSGGHRGQGDGIRDMTGTEANSNSEEIKVLKSVLCAALYANILQIRPPEATYHKIESGTIQKATDPRMLKLLNQSGERAYVHPGSVNYTVGDYESLWLLFYEKVKTSKVFVRDCTMIYPYPLLLFGGQLEVVHDRKLLTVDKWIEFKVQGAPIGVLLKHVRHAFNRLLADKIRDPGLDVTSHPLMDLIIKLVLHDGVW